MNFNNNSAKQLQFQKRVGVYLDGKLDFRFYRDGKLDFREHLRNMLKKEKKRISLLHKQQNNLRLTNLLYIVYKAACRLRKHFV